VGQANRHGSSGARGQRNGVSAHPGHPREDRAHLQEKAGSPYVTDAAIREILRSAKTIAVVGLSSNRTRVSFRVTEYMQRHGYKIIPVNPKETEVLSEPAVASLDEISGPVDIVNIFRRPAFVSEVVEQAIRNGARCIWMQQGIEHAEAAHSAEEAGLTVVMDRCIYRDHSRLGI
jgi:uncharacterized protein